MGHSWFSCSGLKKEFSLLWLLMSLVWKLGLCKLEMCEVLLVPFWWSRFECCLALELLSICHSIKGTNWGRALGADFALNLLSKYMQSQVVALCCFCLGVFRLSVPTLLQILLLFLALEKTEN
ncbi:hypothetical protein U1Q18_031225, partial [Sarracenia purpurea var. burkii]